MRRGRDRETENETSGRRMVGTYQNTVILRVSQLEGCCSDDALQRDRISLTKRMTGNLSWKTTVGPESHQGALRDKTSDETKRVVGLNKRRDVTKDRFESATTQAETNIGWLQDRGCGRIQYQLPVVNRREDE